MLAHSMKRGCTSGLSIVAILTWCQVGAAQGPLPGVEGGNNCILRAYDVSNLIINIEDRPFTQALERGANASGGGGGGGFGGGGGGGGFFSVPNEADGAGRILRGASQQAFGRANIAADSAPKFQFAQFAAGGGRGGAGVMGAGEGEGTEAGNAGPASRITMADLVRVVTNTVARDTWSVNGGGGEIETLGTALLICQTAEVHDQISDLLRQLGKVAADHRTVTIDARWLMLTSDELEDLMVPDQKGVPQVDREQLARLTRRPGSIRGVTSCLSSQLVYVVSGTMKNIVSSWIPVVGSIEPPDHEVQLASNGGKPQIHLVSETSPAATRSRSVGYQPIIQSMNFGALLEIRPTLTPANSEAPALVDLKSTVTIQGAKGAEETKATSDDITPAVDRVSIETLEFATTLRMPLAKPVLVGGMTYIPSDSGAANSKDAAEIDVKDAPAERPQMYLVLEVR
jgi:hypothetical protein